MDAEAAGSGTHQRNLLRACSLLFSFRALASSENAAVRAGIEAQIVGLIADLMPCRTGAVVLGRSVTELRAAGNGRAELEPFFDRVCREGSWIDAGTASAGVALYVREEIAGVLAAWFRPGDPAELPEYRDTLAAIGTLAAAALENVREVERLRTENALLLDRIGIGDSGIVGASPAIRKLQQMIARVAPQDTPVLILGESGTGKELVARALHRQSPREQKTFVAINCAALTETLLESELFGHEKGSFTGAVAQKKGRLELAQGGTVFLDEVGELPKPLQAKLLRVLQEREFERVGGTVTLKLDVRLVAATNRDLLEEVRRGAFREDLYHRLNVVALEVAPLRERAGDIPLLAQYFLERSAARCRRRVARISAEAGQCLLSYPWPGNVRELENAIERAVVLGQGDTVLPEDLPETILDGAAMPEAPGALHGTVVDTKRKAILAAWKEAGGDHQKAAELLNIHPNSLRRLIRVLKVREELG